MKNKIKTKFERKKKKNNLRMNYEEVFISIKCSFPISSTR